MWIKSLVTTSIVKEAMGSWKWQQPYRRVMYVGYLAKNGKVLWRSYDRGRKLSWPQIRRFGFQADYYYSMHNHQITRDDAIRKIGLKEVRKIESRGWSFI